jgi:hypothetical protein
MMTLFQQASTVSGPTLIDLGALVMLTTNTLGLLAIAWRGGTKFGALTQAVDTLARTVERLADANERQIGVVSGLVATFPSLEGRVTRLERLEDER